MLLWLSSTKTNIRGVFIVNKEKYTVHKTDNEGITGDFGIVVKSSNPAGIELAFINSVGNPESLDIGDIKKSIFSQGFNDKL